MRLMVVDDDVRQLDALVRVLRSRVGETQLEGENHFVGAGISEHRPPKNAAHDVRAFGSASSALGALDAEPFDVIITDMRMPNIDGADLLKEVHARWPGMVRIALTAHVDERLAQRAGEHAHQFLLKPCEPAHLEETIRGAAKLRHLLKDEAVLRAVGAIDQLPVLPAIYRELSRAVADPSSSVADIARILDRDAGLCAHARRLASSAYYSRSHETLTTEGAVARLGLRSLKALALSVGVFRAASAMVASIVDLEALQERAGRAARAVETIARRDTDAFTATLLADVGILALGVASPEKLAVIEARIRGGEQRVAVEMDVTGASHASIGAYLLALWGLPMAVVEAVRTHEQLEPTSSRLSAMVYVATRAAEGLPIDEAVLTAALGPQMPDVVAAAIAAATAVGTAPRASSPA